MLETISIIAVTFFIILGIGAISSKLERMKLEAINEYKATLKEELFRVAFRYDDELIDSLVQYYKWNYSTKSDAYDYGKKLGLSENEMHLWHKNNQGLLKSRLSSRGLGNDVADLVSYIGKDLYKTKMKLSNEKDIKMRSKNKK